MERSSNMLSDNKLFFITSFIRSGSNWLRNCLAASDKIEVSGELDILKNIQLLQQLDGSDSVTEVRISKSNSRKTALKKAIVELMKGNLEIPFKNYDLPRDKSTYSFNRSRLFTEHKQIALIEEYFKESKQIVLVRDIRDIVVSCVQWKNVPIFYHLDPIEFINFGFVYHMDAAVSAMVD